MKPVSRFLALALALALACSGCYDRVELEDVAWVQAMGFDEGPEGYLATTMEIGVPHSLGAPVDGGTATYPHYVTMTVLSKTALEAMDLAALTLGRRVSLVHAGLFVFGEEFARADLRSLIGAMDRFREVRGTTMVAVAQGRAEDLLRVNISPLETSPSRFIQTIMQQHGQTGLFEASTLVRDLVNRIESSASSPRCPLIGIASDYKPPSSQQQPIGPGEGYKSTPGVGERTPAGPLTPQERGAGANTTQLTPAELPKSGGGPVVVLGTACFIGGRMVGTLNGEETRAVLMTRGDLEKARFAIPDPQEPDKPELSLGVGVTGVDSKVKVRRTGDQVSIDVALDVEVSYLSPKTMTDYTDPRMTPLAEQAVSQYINALLGATIAKTQQLGTDPFSFGESVRMKFWTWPEFAAFAWLTKYPATPIHTEVKTHIKRYGLDFRPLIKPPSEDLQIAPK